MKRHCLATLVGMLVAGLAGCSLVFGNPDADPSSFAPRVVDSSPAMDPVLPRDGSVEFRVEGHDEDSLVLAWTFFLNDQAVEAGDTDDGEFLAVHQLEWNEELSETTTEVVFEVTDQTTTTDLLWVVTVD